MSEKKSVLSVVVEEFPDLKPEEAKQLVLSSLNWLTNVGALASARLTKLEGRAQTLEHRAQSIAFGVLARMMAVNTTQEQDQVDTVSSVLEAISTSSAPTPM